MVEKYFIIYYTGKLFSKKILHETLYQANCLVEEYFIKYYTSKLFSRKILY